MFVGVIEFWVEQSGSLCGAEQRIDEDLLQKHEWVEMKVEGELGF